MHLSLQDLLTIIGFILGPMGAMIGFMWHHSNARFEKMDLKIDGLKVDINSVEKNLSGEISNVEKRLDEKINGVEKRLGGEINGVEKRLGEKVDAVRDRVSRIEGQLAPASIVAFNQPQPKAS